MSKLDRVNGIHADALRRADGDREVALSILAHRVDALRQSLQEIADGNVAEWKLPTARHIATEALERDA